MSKFLKDMITKPLEEENCIATLYVIWYTNPWVNVIFPAEFILIVCVVLSTYVSNLTGFPPVSIVV